MLIIIVFAARKVWKLINRRDYSLRRIKHMGTPVKLFKNPPRSGWFIRCHPIKSRWTPVGEIFSRVGVSRGNFLFGLPLSCDKNQRLAENMSRIWLTSLSRCWKLRIVTLRLRPLALISFNLSQILFLVNLDFFNKSPS